MLLTTLKIKSERLQICREKCKHFVYATQSCGELVVGKTVKYKNTTKKLCGCIMPIKAHLKIASCPIHKWTSTIEKKDIKKLKKELAGLQGSKVSKEQNKNLTQLYNRMLGNKKKVSNCPSCVKKMIAELNELLNDE